jgi:hypothetical protein
MFSIPARPTPLALLTPPKRFLTRNRGGVNERRLETGVLSLKPLQKRAWFECPAPDSRRRTKAILTQRPQSPQRSTGVPEGNTDPGRTFLTPRRHAATPAACCRTARRFAPSSPSSEVFNRASSVNPSTSGSTLRVCSTAERMQAAVQLPTLNSQGSSPKEQPRGLWAVGRGLKGSTGLLGMAGLLSLPRSTVHGPKPFASQLPRPKALAARSSVWRLGPDRLKAEACSLEPGASGPCLRCAGFAWNQRFQQSQGDTSGSRPAGMWSWLRSKRYPGIRWIATAPKGRSRQKAGLEARFRGLTEDDGRAAKRSAIHQSVADVRRGGHGGRGVRNTRLL